MNTTEEMPALRYSKDLVGYLTEHPEGSTIEDLAEALGTSLDGARRAVQRLRIELGANQEVNLICNPAGQRQRWLYFLVGTVDEAKPWATNRRRDSETRLRTQQAIWTSVAAATDGRTVEGRKARRAQKAMTRLLEDFAEIEEEAAALQS